MANAAAGAFRRIRLAVDSALLVGLVLASVGAVGLPIPPTFSTLRASTVPARALPAAGANLSVDPPSFWMRSGSNVTFQAVWSVVSPLCRATPLWFGWSVDPGNATGSLNATIGPSVVFSASSFDSGSASVEVRSRALLDCGTNGSVVSGTGTATVSIVVPLEVTGLAIGPNPLDPVGTASLNGTVTGGESPYSVEAVWGDGTSSLLSLPSPGPFSLRHLFPSGMFVPHLLVSDSGGDISNDSVAEALSVGAGLRTAIVPASYVAEVGIPVQFTGMADGTTHGMIPLFGCSNATAQSSPAPILSPNGTPFSCTFDSPGVAPVFFDVVSPHPGGPSSSAILYERVVAPPNLSVGLVSSMGEVGEPVGVRVHVSGGDPPLSLAWNLSGSRSGDSETVESDGDGVLSLPVVSAGAYAIGVRVNDSYGEADSNRTAAVEVEPALEANASGARSLLPYGALVEVVGNLLTGCPPFSWWVIPAVLPANGSAEYGTASLSGPFGWNGTYAREGNLSIAIGTADGCGAVWQTVVEVALVPPLSATVTVAPGPTSANATPNETLWVNLSVAGGRAPFQLFVNATDGESWNRTMSADGAFRWLLPATGNGSMVVAITVRDLLGVSVESNVTTTLVPPTDPGHRSPTSTSPPTGAGANDNSTGPTILQLIGLFVSLVFPFGVVVSMIMVSRWRERHRQRGGPGKRGPSKISHCVRLRPTKSRCRSKGRFIGVRRPDEERGRGGDGSRPAAPPSELEPEDDRRGRRGSTDR